MYFCCLPETSTDRRHRSPSPSSLAAAAAAASEMCSYDTLNTDAASIPAVVYDQLNNPADDDSRIYCNVQIENNAASVV